MFYLNLMGSARPAIQRKIAPFEPVNAQARYLVLEEQLRSCHSRELKANLKRVNADAACRLKPRVFHC